ncbi:metal ABC transporter solute-binding protein, Zn/Mn family [Salibacterium qingdaonense]|uniref:Zinc transport system substrate-binding protein n=1 Tax=Salibacterium qingdaonense TaxID=266892 RepID=A0A1I4KJ45_9BACI|nr:zinc ABC transporter substrate-binding protein [Salibacterium qingdaonense]SFL78788.1 zinc transport system substrate-binding protein [Salibacterium qingdaonense]
MKKWVLTVTAVLLTAAIVSACGSGNGGETSGESQETGGEEPLHIYTTLSAWKDFAERIGGSEVEVENLVPAGADAHSFEPTSQTMIDIAESDAFMYNGAGLEGFADAVNDTAADENVTSLAVTEGLNLREASGGHDHSHGEGEHAHQHESSVDPHVWLDPVLAREAAANIRDMLINLRPEKEEMFAENYQTLKEDLNALHEEFNTMAEEAENNTFVVSHAGYGYWEDRYGLSQMAVTGISPSAEPSQKELQAIIGTIETSGINHVMLEQNVSSKVTEVVQEEAGAKALTLHNLATLTEEEIEAGEDYFSLMRQNIENMKTALQYSVDNGSSSESEEEHSHEGHNHSHEGHNH